MLNDYKIFITGPFASGKHALAKFLRDQLPEEFELGLLTSSDPRYKAGGNYKYYSAAEIQKIFQNRQFVFLRDGFGLTTTELERRNLFVLSLEDLAMLPNKVYAFNKVLFVVVWPDESERMSRYSEAQKPYDAADAKKRQRGVLRQVREILSDKEVIDATMLTNLETMVRIINYIEEENPRKKKKLLCAEISPLCS